MPTQIAYPPGHLPEEYHGLNPHSLLYPGLLVAIPETFSYGSLSHLHEAKANNTLTAASSPNWMLDATHGPVINFPGSGSRWQTNDVVAYQDSIGFTMAVWINSPLVTGSTQHLITFEESGVGNNQKFIRLLTAGTVQVQAKNSGGTADLQTSLTTLSNDTWYLLASRYNGALLEIWINGVFDRSVAHTGNMISITGQYFTLGAASNGSNPYAGMMRVAGVWDYALPDDAMLFMYTHPFDLYRAPPYLSLFAGVTVLTGDATAQGLAQTTAQSTLSAAALSAAQGLGQVVTQSTLIHSAQALAQGKSQTTASLTQPSFTWYIEADLAQDETYNTNLLDYMIGPAEWQVGIIKPYSGFGEPGTATMVLDNTNGEFSPEVTGSELVTNGEFDNWTADNPDNWTVTGESGSDPEVSEVGSLELHGGSGTGRCNFYTTGTAVSITQDILTVGTVYEVTFRLEARDSGRVLVKNGATQIGGRPFYMTGIKSIVFEATDTTLIFVTSGATNITIDSVSCKAVAQYGKRLKRGVLMRIRLDKSGTSTTLFTGRIADVQPMPGLFRSRTVNVRLQDIMLDLLDYDYLPKLSTDTTADAAILDVLDQAVIPYPYAHTYGMIGVEGHSELDETMTLYAHNLANFQTGKTVLSYIGDNSDKGYGVRAQKFLRDAVAAELGGRFWFDNPSNKFVFHNRHRDILNATPAATYNCDDFVDVQYQYGADVRNIVRVTYEPRSLGSANSIIWSGGVPLRLRPGQERTITARYRDPDNPNTRVGATVTQPMKAGTDYVANQAEDGSGQDMTAFIRCGAQRNAQGAVVTIANAATQEVYITTLQIRGTPLLSYTPETTEYRDPDSLRQHGEQPWTTNITMLDDPGLASDYARSIAARFGQPVGAISMVTLVASKATSAFMEAVAARTIGDAITINEAFLGHSDTYFIIGMRFALMAAHDNPVRASWILEPGQNIVGCLLDVTGRDELDINAILML